MKKLIKKYKSELSTVAGIIMAVATAWESVNWADFKLSVDGPKLAISALIAIGGYVTQLKD